MLVTPDNLNDKLNVYVDGSYLIYWSIHSTAASWKRSSVNASVCKDPDQDDLPDLLVYQDFVKELESKFLNNVRGVFNIIKQNKDDIGYTNHEDFFFCLDAEREENWRLDYFKQYKGHRRTAKKEFQVGKVFDYIVSVLMPKCDFDDYFNIKTLILTGVEADDIIATQIMDKPNDINVIISSDHDFLQLKDMGVIQYDLKRKRVEWVSSKFKVESMTANEFKLCKILSGDVSDNIPGVFPNTGPVKAMKLVQNPTLLKEKLMECPQAIKQFKLNTKLIDFNHIPKRKTQEILEYVQQETLI